MPKTALTNWNALPDDIWDEIITGTVDLVVVAHLGQTCHRMHRLCRAPCLIQNFVYAQVPDTEIPQRIRELAEDLQRNPGLKQYTRLLTPQVATDLYDRVLQAPCLSVDVKLELQSLLCLVNRPVFECVVSATPPLPEFADLIAEMPQMDAKAAPLPDHIVAFVKQYVDEIERSDGRGFAADLIGAVRRRYQAPFDQVFPENRAVASALCRQYPVEIAAPAVVLALQRYGIRFALEEYLRTVPIQLEHTAAVLPLLYVDDRAAIVPEKYLACQTSRHLETVLAQPTFRYRLQSNPADFLQLIYHLIDNQKYGHLCRLLDQAFVHELVNAVDDQLRTPLFYALQQQAFDAVRLLLEVPTINLYQETRAGTTVFHEIYQIRDQDPMTTCGFSTVVLSDIDNFMAYLRSLIEQGQHDLLQYLIGAPFFASVSEHRKLWLLQYAQAPDLYEAVLATLQTVESPEQNTNDDDDGNNNSNSIVNEDDRMDMDESDDD